MLRTTRITKLLLVFGALSVLMACGGGGGGGFGLSQAPVQSQSFSPGQATTATGDPAPLLWWLYQINGGGPVVADLNGVNVTATFRDFLITINTATKVRTVQGDGPISGSSQGLTLSGSYSVDVRENLQFGSTLFLDESLRIILDLRGGGASARVDLSSTAVPSPPWEWFLDRDDLHLIPTGLWHEQSVDAAVSSTVTVSGTGIPPTTETVNENVSSNDRWTIVSNQNSMTVLGRTYDNIVVVDRETTGVDPQTGQPTPVTIRYYVAKGIGFIRADNLLSFLTTPLSWQLVDTNLVQN